MDIDKFPHLKKKIISFIPARCLSCKHVLLENTPDTAKYKDYNNHSWRITKNKYFKSDKYDVCNWCYYYVWEYP